MNIISRDQAANVKRLDRLTLSVSLLAAVLVAWAVLFPVSAVANGSASSELPHRIISTDAGTTEILLGLNQGASLVGIDVTSSIPKSHANQVTAKTIGYHRNLSAEGLLSLTPSILFGGEHIGPKEAVAALKHAGVNLVQQKSALSTDDVKHNIRIISEALSLSPDALLDQVKRAESVLSEFRSQAAGKKAVFLLYLQGRGMKQAGKGTSGDALMSLLGLQNSLQEPGYRAVSAEGLLAIQPDVVLVASQSPQVVSEVVKDYPALRHTPAAKNEKVLFIDASALVSGMSLKAISEAVRVSQAL